MSAPNKLTPNDWPGLDVSLKAREKSIEEKNTGSAVIRPDNNILGTRCRGISILRGKIIIANKEKNRSKYSILREGVLYIRIMFAIKAITRNARIAMVLTTHVEPKSSARSVIALVSSKRKAAPNIKKCRLFGVHMDFMGNKNLAKHQANKRNKNNT